MTVNKVDENVHAWDYEDTSVYVGDLGVTMPVDFADPIAHDELGWLADDSTEIDRAESYTDLMVQGGKTMRTKVKSIKNTIKFQCTEENARVLMLQYPDAVLTTSANGTVTLSTEGGSKKAESSWIVDFRDGDYRKRYLIPRGEVTGRGKLVHATDKFTIYEFTVTIYGSFSIEFSKLEGAPVHTP
jgi:hypothetical protein